jgi:hypothetical protein
MAELCRLVQRGEVDPEAALASAPIPGHYARVGLERSAASA